MLAPRLSASKFVGRVAPGWAAAVGVRTETTPVLSAGQEAQRSLTIRLAAVPPPPPDAPEEAERTTVVNGDIRRVWWYQRIGTGDGDEAVEALFVEIDFRGTAWVCQLVVDQLWIRARKKEDAFEAFPQVWRDVLWPRLGVDLTSMSAYRCVIAPAEEAGRWDVHIETGEGPIVIEPPERPYWHTGQPPPPPAPPAADRVDPGAVLAWQVDDSGKETLEAVLGGGGWLLMHTRTWRRTHGIMGVTRLEVRGAGGGAQAGT